MLLGSSAVLLAGSVPARPAAAPLSRASSIRMQWDLPRFVETANYFNGPGEVLKRILPSPQRPRVGRDGLIWGASRLDLLEFGPLDDVVMGGASQSGFSLAPSKDFGVWSGTITTENNGGFAGVRSRAVTPAMDLSSFKGIRLRVKGDGKRYKLIVRDDYNWNGIAWAYFFDTSVDPADFEVVEAPWDAFVPTLFARRVPGVKLKPRSITTVQLTLSKFEVDTQLNPKFDTGPFRMELQSVEAF